MDMFDIVLDNDELEKLQEDSAAVDDEMEEGEIVESDDNEEEVLDEDQAEEAIEEILYANCDVLNALPKIAMFRETVVYPMDSRFDAIHRRYDRRDIPVLVPKNTSGDKDLPSTTSARAKFQINLLRITPSAVVLSSTNELLGRFWNNQAAQGKGKVDDKDETLDPSQPAQPKPESSKKPSQQKKAVTKSKDAQAPKPNEPKPEPKPFQSVKTSFNLMSQMPHMSLRLNWGVQDDKNNRAVSVFFFMDQLARLDDEEPIIDVQFNKSEIKSTHALVNRSVKNSEWLQEMCIDDQLLHIEIGLRQAPKFVGISTAELETIDVGTEADPNLRFLSQLYQGGMQNLHIYQKWLNHPIIVDGKVVKKAYYTQAMKDILTYAKNLFHLACVEGNLWYYRMQKTGYELTDSQFPWDRIPPPRSLNRKWTVKNDGKSTTFRPLDWVKFGTVTTYPDAEVAAAFRILGNIRARQYSTDLLRAFSSSSPPHYNATFVAHPHRKGQWYGELEFVAGESASKESSRYKTPELGTRMRIKFRPTMSSRFYTFEGEVMSSSFLDDSGNTKASVTIGIRQTNIRTPDDFFPFDAEIVYQVGMEFIDDPTSLTRSTAAIQSMSKPLDRGPDAAAFFLETERRNTDKSSYYKSSHDAKFQEDFTWVLRHFDLDDNQMTSCLNALNSAHCIELIWGPPGTGKTRCLTALCCAFAYCGLSVQFVSGLTGAVTRGRQSGQELYRKPKGYKPGKGERPLVEEEGQSYFEAFGVNPVHFDGASTRPVREHFEKIDVEMVDAPIPTDNSPPAGNNTDEKPKQKHMVPQSNAPDVDESGAAPDSRPQPAQIDTKEVINEWMIELPRQWKFEFEEQAGLNYGYFARLIKFINAQQKDPKSSSHQLIKSYIQTLGKLNQNSQKKREQQMDTEKYSKLRDELLVLEHDISKAMFQTDTKLVYSTCSLAAHPSFVGKYQAQVLIIDEASQADLGELMLPCDVHKENLDLIILAGDPEQLTPKNVPMAANEAYNSVQNNPFSRTVNMTQPNWRVTMLGTQYRMHAGLARLVSKVWYKDILKTADVVHLRRDPALIKFYDFLKPLENIWDSQMGLLCVHVDGVSEITEGTTTVGNMPEVEAVTAFMEAMSEHDIAIKNDMACLTTYAGQRRNIQSAMGRLDNAAKDFKLSDVPVLTTNRAEGSEFGVTVLSMVNNEVSRPFKMGYAANSHLLCVQFSRAKFGHVVFGNFAGWCQGFLNKDYALYANKYKAFKRLLTNITPGEKDKRSVIVHWKDLNQALGLQNTHKAPVHQSRFLQLLKWPEKEKAPKRSNPNSNRPRGWVQPNTKKFKIKEARR